MWSLISGDPLLMSSASFNILTQYRVYIEYIETQYRIYIDSIFSDATGCCQLEHDFFSVHYLLHTNAGGFRKGSGKSTKNPSSNGKKNPVFRLY